MRTRATTAAGRRRASTRAGARARTARPRGGARPPRRPAPRTRRAPARPAPKRGSGALSWRGRLVAASALALILGAAYFGWLRDSSLVAVTDVDVQGVTSHDSAQIVAALTDAAEEMTTLHVRTGDLADAVSGFPTVASVSADANFPHGLTIQVNERRPVMIAQSLGRVVPVAADGTLLDGLPATGEDVPTVAVETLPEGGRLTGDALEEALVLGGAPEPLLALVQHTGISREFGPVVTLRGGIDIRFGNSSRPQAKWDAAAAVLADPRLTQLSYVDVQVPERPSVGGTGASTESSTTVLSLPDATDPASAAAAPATDATTSVAP